MNRIIKKALSSVLCAALCISVLATGAVVLAKDASSLMPIIFATPVEGDPFVVEVDSPTVTAGTDFDVKLTVKSNPGVIMVRLAVDYDKDVLTLKSATNGELFDDSVTTLSDSFNSPYKMIWGNGIEGTVSETGVIATLHFTAVADCNKPINTAITVSTVEGSDIIDDSLGENKIPLSVSGGAVTVNPVEASCTAVVASATLDLSGKIGVMVSFELPQKLLDDDGAYVEMSYGGIVTDTMKVSLKNGMYDSEKDRYGYKFPVAVMEIYENVSFKIFDGAGNQVTLVKGKTSRTPVEDNTFKYAAIDFINSKKTSSDAELSAVVSRLEEFGKFARLYFEYKSSEVSEPSIPDVNMTNFSAYKSVISGTNPNGIKLSNATLSLESDTTIIVIFKTEDETVDISKYTFICDGAPISVTKVSDIAYEAYIKGIGSADLDKTFTVSVSDGNDTRTLNYSALSFAYNRASTKPDETVGKLGKAIYNYNLAAEAYFAG